MQCYSQLTAPTAVNGAVSLHFLSSSANNLVVAKHSVLQVFALKSVLCDVSEAQSAAPLAASTSDNDGTSSKSSRKERSLLTKLVLVSECELAGVISSLARVKGAASRSGGDLLLVALRDAKLSLVEWDPEKYAISTVSLHFYEKEDVLGPPWQPALNECQCILTVDPNSRCAALKFGGRQLAIMPLSQGRDDLAMDEDHQELQGAQKRDEPTSPTLQSLNGTTQAPSSRSTSFVMSLLALDPALVYPQDLAFLYEYLEPTLGVLSSRVAASSALLRDRQDPMAYTVYTLDLEQRASTTLLSVTDLPYDLFAIVPLALPIGGVLLVGSNEIIHVDQAGKTNGVAVNELAAKASSFAMAAQTDLDLRLEGCRVEHLNNARGEMLIILSTGQMAFLSFQIDGRSVSGLRITKVESVNGGDLLHAPASCTALIGRGRMFVGSIDSDSHIIGWASKTQKPLRRRSTMDMDLAHEANGDLGVPDGPEPTGADSDAEIDDDLYADLQPKQETIQRTVTASDPGADDYTFSNHDRLSNLSPLSSICITQRAQPTSETDGSGSGASARFQLCAVSGGGRRSSIVQLSPSLTLQTHVIPELPPASRVWSFSVDAADSNTIPSAAPDETNIIVAASSARDPSEPGESHVYITSNAGIQELTQGDFEADAGSSIEVTYLSLNSRLVQILPNEIRSFDADFSLAQILPLVDDDDENRQIAVASVAEPFILLLKNDKSITILRADETGDLEEVEWEGDSQTSWQSGCLFDDVDDVFRLTFEGMDDSNSSSVLMFLLHTKGGLHIYRLPNLREPLYVAEGLSFLPGYLQSDFTVRRSTARETLAEILVAEIGDATAKTPYLIVRSAQDDLTLYAPYQNPTREKANERLCFAKVPCRHVSRATDQDDVVADRPLRKLTALADVGGYSTVLLSGPYSYLCIKSAASLPRIRDISNSTVKDVALLNTPKFPHSLLCVDTSGSLYSARISPQTNFEHEWVVRTLFTTDRIQALEYHEPSDRFVIAVSAQSDFRLPPDENHPEWADEKTTFLPQVEQDCLKLFDPATCTITDTFDLTDHEIVTSIKTLSLEVSEVTHKRNTLIAVGTTILRGENLTTEGVLYVFDVHQVVPEPERPETGKKLKLISKVKEKGAVTSISQVGTQGFLIVASGQRCFVRGLKEDGSLLPVAFIDVQCYTSVVKELQGTGFCVVGDAARGAWLLGYSEQPYGLRFFGKSSQHISVVAAELLPEGRSLHLFLADMSGAVHVFQFDPDNPKSLSGQRLLHQSTFHTGFPINSMTLLPRQATSWETRQALMSNGMDQADNESSDDQDALANNSSTASVPYQILLTAQNGAMALLTPLQSDAYRSLASLQAWLGSTALPSHPLGLGPKAHRAVEVDLSVGGRAMLDGTVLSRWSELGSWKRAEGVARAGVDGEWEVRAMFEGVGGRGLGYLV